MISHRNVIANTLQISAFEEPHRERLRNPSEVALGLLPQSHIYSLVVVCHATLYRGDQVINLPKFELHSYLNAIQRFKISGLYVVRTEDFWMMRSRLDLRNASFNPFANCQQVPPIIITMLRNKSVCDKYDLTSVQFLFTGAAPLGEETAQEFQNQYPEWKIRQGYGMYPTKLTSQAMLLIAFHRTHRDMHRRLLKRT